MKEKKGISRRQFMKYSMGGVGALVVGAGMPWILRNTANAQVVHEIHFDITDALKEMVTHNVLNPEAECYFWIFKAENLAPECPGPHIFVTQGDTIALTVHNLLDEPHAWSVPALGLSTGPIAAGAIWSGSVTIPADAAGAYLYYDDLNAPVNRMMGLHGALVVVPDPAATTPYGDLDPISGVQKLFNAFGTTEHFPGLAWSEGDAVTPPFRRYIWLTHEASPKLFAEVGLFARQNPGVPYPAQQFMDAFLRDPFVIHTYNSQLRPDGNRVPQYFTINGQSGHFAHNSAWITPMIRVGEPLVVHILNAGLWTHSMHLHANHFYVTRVNGVVSENPIWVDVYNVEPMDRIDYTVPAMRPPDIGTVRGIGYPETPLTSVNGNPVWPPIEEFDRYYPEIGTDMAVDILANVIDLAERQSPLCYPMHDHSEPSQTSQGGNYNCGLISGIYFVGDRNTPGYLDFPMDEEFMHMLMPHGGPHVYGVSVYTGAGHPAPPVMHEGV